MHVTHIQVKEFVNQLIDEMSEWAQRTYNLDCSWKPDVRVYTNERYRNSWGGTQESIIEDIDEFWRSCNKIINKPYVRIVAYEYIKRRRNRFIEYEHIENDPEIGNINNANWKTCVAAITAHEVAHAIDFTLKKSVNRRLNHTIIYSDESIPDRGHDKSWQIIYRRLRRKFVNYRI